MALMNDSERHSAFLAAIRTAALAWGSGCHLLELCGSCSLLGLAAAHREPAPTLPSDSLVVVRAASPEHGYIVGMFKRGGQ